MPSSQTMDWRFAWTYWYVSKVSPPGVFNAAGSGATARLPGEEPHGLPYLKPTSRNVLIHSETV